MHGKNIVVRIKQVSLFIFVLCCIGNVVAAASPTQSAPPFSLNAQDDDKNNKKGLAARCKELALKIDWLGRYQDRPACTQALDGTVAYFAAHHLEGKEIRQAKALLEEAIVKLNYAIDINCYGQDDMKQVAAALQEILEQL